MLHANGLIKEGWSERVLSDLCVLVGEKFPPGESSDVPYVGLEHISQGTGRLLGQSTLSEIRSSASRFQKDDVLFGKLRPNLKKYWLADSEGACSTEILVLRPKNCLPGFLYQIVQTEGFISEAVSRMFGTKMPRVSWEILKQYRVAVPSLDKQRKIVEILSTVDEEILSTDKIIVATERLKCSLVKELFTKGIGHTKFKKTKVGIIPDSWAVRKLGEILQFSQYGISMTSGPSGIYPMFRMNNILGGKMVAEPMVYVDLSSEEASKYLLKRGDILINRTNSIDLVGKTGIFELEGDFVFASYLVRLRADESLILPEFLNFFLNSSSVQAMLKNFATKGVSQANINPTKLKKRLECVVPPLAEQTEIVRVLESVDSKLKSARLVVGSLVKFKKGLMRDLLSGSVKTG